MAQLGVARPPLRRKGAMGEGSTPIEGKCWLLRLALIVKVHISCKALGRTRKLVEELEQDGVPAYGQQTCISSSDGVAACEAHPNCADHNHSNQAHEWLVMLWVLSMQQ